MHMRFLGVKKYAEKKKNILNASDKSEINSKIIRNSSTKHGQLDKPSS